MHSLPQFTFDLLKFCPHAVAPGLPLEQEVILTRLSTDESKAQEIEGFRFVPPLVRRLTSREGLGYRQVRERLLCPQSLPANSLSAAYVPFA